MKAIHVQPDHSLVWADAPDPVLGLGEVLVRVQATAVNRADLLQRRGQYPPPPGAPPWMGLEAAGVIEEVGPEAAPWREGGEVCCLLAGGGYAEKVAVHRDLLLPIPSNFTPEEAAALPEVMATAYLNLVIEAGLARGETVLIHAGASGVGTAAIQLARVREARVITTVGSAEKVAFVRQLGAEVVIDHNREDVTARLRELSSEGSNGARSGIDVVLDCLGGEDLAVHLPLLNPGGRWIVIGLMKGRTANLDLRPLLSKKLRLIGSALRTRPMAEKARILAGLRREVWTQLECGDIRPVIHRVLPITEAAEAHAILERNENIGKVVLSVPGPAQG